jgi:hypothetical protein
MTIQETLKQPTTILGVAGLVGTTAGTIAHVLTHDMALAVGVATVAGSIVHILMPDNSGAQSSIEKLVTDAVTAGAQKRLAAAMPLLIQDGMAVVASLAAPAQSAMNSAPAQNSAQTPGATQAPNPAAIPAAA